MVRDSTPRPPRYPVGRSKGKKDNNKPVRKRKRRKMADIFAELDKKYTIPEDREYILRRTDLPPSRKNPGSRPDRKWKAPGNAPGMGQHYRAYEAQPRPTYGSFTSKPKNGELGKSRGYAYMDAGAFQTHGRTVVGRGVQNNPGGIHELDQEELRRMQVDTDEFADPNHPRSFNQRVLVNDVKPNQKNLTNLKFDDGTLDLTAIRQRARQLLSGKKGTVYIPRGKGARSARRAEVLRIQLLMMEFLGKEGTDLDPLYQAMTKYYVIMDPRGDHEGGWYKTDFADSIRAARRSDQVEKSITKTLSKYLTDEEAALVAKDTVARSDLVQNELVNPQRYNVSNSLMVKKGGRLEGKQRPRRKIPNKIRGPTGLGMIRSRLQPYQVGAAKKKNAPQREGVVRGSYGTRAQQRREGDQGYNFDSRDKFGMGMMDMS